MRNRSEIAYLENYYKLERIIWYSKFSLKFYLILNALTQPSASSDILRYLRIWLINLT